MDGGDLRGAFELAYGARFELIRRLSSVAYEGLDLTAPIGQTRVRVKLLGVANEVPADALPFEGGFAIVAPFVTGATLSQVLRTMRSHPHARYYRDAMFFGFAPLLCRAVEGLHGRGAAHGGLHGDNVIVQWQEDVFAPALVDAGASRNAGGRDAWLSADRSCVVRHVIDLTRGSFWHDEIAALVRGLDDELPSIRAAIESTRLVLGSLEDAAPTSFTSDRLRETLRLATTGGWSDPQRRFLRRAARRLGRERLYDVALTDHGLRLYDPESVPTLDALLGDAAVPADFSFESLVKAPRYPAAAQV